MRRHHRLTWLTSGLLAGVLGVVVGLSAIAADPVPAPSAVAAPASPAETRLAPAVDGAGGSPAAVLTEAARQLPVRAAGMVSNFLVLMDRVWAQVWRGTLIVLCHGAIWGFIAGLAGLFLGWGVYFFLERRGWLTIKRRWYPWVAWLWPLLFILCFLIAFAYAGFWAGMGHRLKSYIRDERVLDKAVVSLWAAVVLDHAEYRLKADVTAAELENMLGDGRRARELTDREWQQAVQAVTKQLPAGPVWSLLAGLLVDRGAAMLADYLGGFDPRAVILFLLSRTDIEDCIAGHPQAAPLLAALGAQLAGLRLYLCQVIDAVVYPNILGGLAIALIPIGVFLLFRLALWVFRRLRRWFTGAAAPASAQLEPPKEPR